MRKSKKQKCLLIGDARFIRVEIAYEGGTPPSLV